MEQKKMTSNKKFTVALCAMAVALVAVVGGLIGVYAALSQTIGASFDVQYSIGGHIAGSMAASYQVVGNDKVDMKADGETVITFGVNDTVGSSFAAEAAQIKLDKDHQSIEFVYTFTNTGDNDYTATLTDNCTARNVEITYTTDAAGVEADDKTVGEEATVAMEYEVTVAKNATVKVTVTVALADDNKSAYYTSATNAGITWVLETTAEQG